MPKPASPEIAARNAFIVAAIRAGRPVAELAAERGLRPATVCSIVNRAGLSARRQRERPETGEPEYTADEQEFLAACVRFRVQHARPFLLATDYLTVLLSLGYHRVQ